MAGASMKDIKNRIKSVQSTMQITKAMELVASSKLRHAKERAERTRPYFHILEETLEEISGSCRGFSSPYMTQRDVKRSCFVVIAGDRGLAGGYNSNIFKLAAAEMEGKDCIVLPIGKRSAEYFERRKYPILSSDFTVVENVDETDCEQMAKLLCQSFLKKEFDEVRLIYTNFKSMLSQEAASVQILPVPKKETKAERGSMMQFEPSPEEVFAHIVPVYLSGMLFGAVSESLASELGARRTAMDAASKNAQEMVDGLNLKYNRARQGVITQEITEIVSGAEALK